MLRIIVTGAKGRMGSRICALIDEATDLELAAAIDQGDSLEAALASSRADAIIDFTLAAAVPTTSALAARARVPLVIGTTGISDEQNAAVVEASGAIPVVRSTNMSIGVNVMWKLIEQAAATLGNQYSIEIEETHHEHKLDRPSGTAKTMLELAAHSSGREPAAIHVESIRRGEVIGDHSITFTGPAEKLAIAHHASSRDIFAQGALAAARWIAGKPAGLYTMADVLGLK